MPKKIRENDVLRYGDKRNEVLVVEVKNAYLLVMTVWGEYFNLHKKHLRNGRWSKIGQKPLRINRRQWFGQYE